MILNSDDTIQAEFSLSLLYISMYIKKKDIDTKEWVLCSLGGREPSELLSRMVHESGCKKIKLAIKYYLTPPRV